MQAHLINLQQSIISLLGDALAGRFTNTSLLQLVDISNSVRVGSIDALANQFQRMYAAASFTGPQMQISIISPVGLERRRTSRQYCLFALYLQNEGEDSRECLMPPTPYEVCPGCRSRVGGSTASPELFSLGASRSGNFWDTICHFRLGRQSEIAIPASFFLKCHLQHPRARDGLILFGCLFCEENGKLCNFTDWCDFARHIDKRHRDHHLEYQYRP